MTVKMTLFCNTFAGFNAVTLDWAAAGGAACDLGAELQSLGVVESLALRRGGQRPGTSRGCIDRDSSLVTLPVQGLRC